MDKRTWPMRAPDYSHMYAGKQTKPLASFVQIPPAWLAFLETRPGELTWLIAVKLLDLDFKDQRRGRPLNPMASAWIKENMSQSRMSLWRALQALQEAGLISLERGPIVRVLVR